MSIVWPLLGLFDNTRQQVTAIETRLATLEDNDILFEVWEGTGTSQTGQVTVYADTTVELGRYEEGIDAISVRLDTQGRPTDEISVDSNGDPVLVGSIDGGGNYALSATPVADAALVYFLRTTAKYSDNVPYDKIANRFDLGVEKKYVDDNFEGIKDNLIYVAKSGGNFTTIKDALDSITDNDSDNRYTIMVSPGVYSEDNPLQGKSYVSVKSTGGNNTVRVSAANASTDLFTMADLFFIDGLTLYGVTGAGNYAANMAVPGTVVVRSCTVVDCSNGVHVNHASAKVDILDCALFTIGGTITRGVHVEAGNVVVDYMRVVNNSTVTTIIDGSGANSLLTVFKVLTFSSNVSTALKLYDGIRAAGDVNNIVAANDGLVVYGDNTDVRFDAMKIFNMANDGVRVENTGTNVNMSLFSLHVEGCGNKCVNILNANSTSYGSGFASVDGIYIEPGAGAYASFIDLKEGDEGTNFYGEVHVGSPQNPTEMVVGEGDSYTNGMLVYTYDGADYVDVTTAASSASGSTFTFPNTNANTAIYVTTTVDGGGAGARKHFGIKSSISVAAVLGAGDIILEYWNGSTWAELNNMTTQSNAPYYPYAKQLFNNTGSYQTRYDINLYEDNWTAIDPMTLGTAYRWVRFRISTGITTAPIFEQFKVHSNRFEVNSDGFGEFFGTSRPTGQLPLNFSTARPFEGNMQNQTIYVSENIGVGYTQNKFTATGDKTGVAIFLPYDCDTSSHIHLIWAGRADTSHTITWTIRWAWVKGGDAYSTTEPAAITNSRSATLSQAVTAGQVSEFHYHMDISGMISRRETGEGDQLWISLQPSTLSGTFSLTVGTANYTRWCFGGHI